MTVTRWHVILGVATFLACVSAAQAQVSPHIGYVYPAGGQQGGTFQVRVGGQFLDGADKVLVSGAGVQATVAEHFKPITQKEFARLREQLTSLQEKRQAAMRSGARRGKPADAKDAKPAGKEVKWTAEDEKLLAEIRKKLATFIRRPANPAIAETVTIQITVAADAQPGEREIRLGASLGLSNPLMFQVGQLPEFSQRAAQVAQEGPAKPARFRFEPPVGRPKPETNVTLPAVVNGQIMPGAVDRYRFTARKGERLVIAASARQLIPYLADAVPGWFQATLALYDAKGKELAYDDDFRFNPDPVLYYEVPADGEYVVEIKDAIFRGREDFVYRITIGEQPFITGIFPLGGRGGVQTTVELSGWNLPVSSLAVDNKGKAPGVYPLSVRKGQQVSNLVPFAVDNLPECLEKEPNDRPAQAQRVTLPVILNGRIDGRDDCDVFSFEGRAGSEIVAEVYARRLNSPLDSVLELTDAAGKQLAFNDDHEDKAVGLLTHHADSWLSATLPADGTYYLHLRDAQHKGGPEYAYRLRISPPRHDFELRVVPASINARPGATVPISVYAVRRDGFAGDIALALKGAPEGFTLSGAWVPAGQDEVRATLTMPATPPKEPVSLSLEGRAAIQGREVSHPVVPAEDMMQAFAYRHLVPAQQLEVAVGGRYAPAAAVKILGAAPVKIPAGGTARVSMSVPRAASVANVGLALSEPPDGITIQQTRATRDGAEIVLQSDAAKVKPGLKGNLIVTVSARGPAAGAKKSKPGNPRALPAAALPAIPFEIVAP